jgi:MFS family permease
MTNEFRRGWPVVLAAACGAGAGVTGVTFYSLSLFLVPLTQAFDWSRTQVSAAKTFITIGLILTAPIAGHFADRLGVRRIALASMTAFALAVLAMTQINANILTFYGGLLVMAAAGGGTTALVWTRGVATWFVRRRGVALALTLTGTGLAGILTPPVIGGLIDGFGWQAGYVGIAAVAALSLIPVWLSFAERGAAPADAVHEAPAHGGLTVREAVRTRRFWQNGFAFTLVGAVVSSLSVHLVPLLTDSGLSRATAASVASILGAAVIVGRLLTGVLVDRFHPPYVAGLFLFLPVIGMALFLVAPNVLPLIVLAAIMIGFAAGSEVDLLPYLTARYFGLKSYGRIYGWQFVMFYSGVGVGPVSFGWVFDRFGSYTLALLWGMPALAIGALAIASLGRASPMDRTSAP